MVPKMRNTPSRKSRDEPRVEAFQKVLAVLMGCAAKPECYHTVVKSPLRLYNKSFAPSWRHWQTRMVQVHVLARVWGFESLRWHQRNLEFAGLCFAQSRILWDTKSRHAATQ